MNILHVIVPVALFVAGLFGKLWLRGREVTKLTTKVKEEANRADTAEAKGRADGQVDAKVSAGLDAAAARLEDPTVAGKKGADKIQAIDAATRKRRGLSVLIFLALVLGCHTPPPKTIVITPKSCLVGLGPRPMPPERAAPCDDEWADYYEREQAWVDSIEVACQ